MLKPFPTLEMLEFERPPGVERDSSELIEKPEMAKQAVQSGQGI